MRLDIAGSLPYLARHNGGESRTKMSARNHFAPGGAAAMP